MSLLLLFHPRQDEAPPAPSVAPARTLLGVGLTLACLAVPALGLLIA